MRSTLFVLASLAAAAGIVTAAGCSSSSGTSSTDSSASGTSASGSSSSATGTSGSSSGASGASVSFTNDLMPLFAQSCSTAMGGVCHGSASVADLDGGQPRPYFGPYAGKPDSGIIDKVYTGLIGVHSNEDPNMAYVTPGDPTHSYLWRKINGDLSGLAADCQKSPFEVSTAQPCGEQMPNASLGNGAPPLDTPTQQKIEAWIQAGASK